ncbi:UNVERIFIED_CONTAM: hypothetical protein HDU68_007191 [Siphonaria sp. JEL0065]|nr:hypothetical protein HDU68_007191 [Siphonaria sp. JEL0065]
MALVMATCDASRDSQYLAESETGIYSFVSFPNATITTCSTTTTPAILGPSPTGCQSNASFVPDNGNMVVLIGAQRMCLSIASDGINVFWEQCVSQVRLHVKDSLARQTFTAALIDEPINWSGVLGSASPFELQSMDHPNICLDALDGSTGVFSAVRCSFTNPGQHFSIGKNGMNQTTLAYSNQCLSLYTNSDVVCREADTLNASLTLGDCSAANACGLGVELNEDGTISVVGLIGSGNGGRKRWCLGTRLLPGTSASFVVALEECGGTLPGTLGQHFVPLVVD